MEYHKRFAIKVPATSANLGPGFDALSLALKLYLTVTVTVSHPSPPSTSPSPSLPQQDESGVTSSDYSRIHITYKGDSEGKVSTNPRENLITTTMMHVIQSAKATLPAPHFEIHLSVHNDIPIGKGLGSSGATIVAGCLIANELCALHLDRIGIMKYALEIENHPDNISASIAGGFVVSCVEPETSEPILTSTPISSHIKAVIVVPAIEKIGGTHSARSVLPSSYSQSDVVYNIQRASLLTALLTKNYATDEEVNKLSYAFAASMKDKIHQQYRQDLVPGLSDILTLTSSPLKGLLGVCMSGAGPSVLALARAGHEGELLKIGDAILACFKKQGIDGEIKVVEFDKDGATCTPL